MKIFLLWIQLLSLLLILPACTTSSRLPTTTSINQVIDIPINHGLFDITDIQVIDEETIFKLSPNQQTAFLTDYHTRVQEGTEPHKALSNFLTTEMGSFTYYGETYIAEQAMRLDAGNCMSLAILTTALSKLVKLDISYREVSTLPVFEKQNNTILSSSHVQTIIYSSPVAVENGHISPPRPGVVIDYFPNSNNRLGRKLSIDTFLASYYQNIASDALVVGALDKSFAYALKAKEMDPTNTKVLNFLAVLHKRKGDLVTAERIYQIGLENNKKNVSLLSNYISLLKAQSRETEAKLIQTQLDGLDDPNPYNWLGEAYLAQDNKQYTKAIKYYKKVITRAPYVHQAYKGLYQIYSQQGKHRQAKLMLKNALEWTYELEERKLYKYKLYSLNRE
jgi:tetratricopeptide (TPR) repeat protein